MAFHLWLTFAAAYLATTLSPGPNVLLVIRNTLRYGAPSTGVTILGNLLSQLLIVLLVACGVGAMLAALPSVFLVMKIAGAAYLMWIGFKQVRGSPTGAGSESNGSASCAQAPLVKRAVLREAFLVSISNPKTLIFLSAFMPQFVEQEHPLAQQFAIMYATIAMTVLCVHCVYSFSASRLKQRLRQSRLGQRLRYAGGALFVLLGLRLLASEHS